MDIFSRAMIKNSSSPQVVRLIAKDLAAKRGEELIFEGLDLELHPGDALVLTGANGTGKSTLLRVLAGLLKPERGRMRVVDSSDSEEGLPSEHSHYLGHRNAMKSELSARENLLFWRRMFSAGSSDDEKIVEQAADAVGLAAIAHLPFGYLSAGQQRRLAFAKLLVAFRPIWLLDEPTTALDVDADRAFTALIEDHRAQGGIVLAATHRDLGLRNSRSLEMKGFAGTGGGIWG